INSDTLVTLQKFFEEDCTSHTGMSQTENNTHEVAMKITADIMQHAD
ncbi:TPA: pentapeptide repeat-containing protein, partial [Escherichia coli]